jgi:hypothetical protein
VNLFSVKLIAGPQVAIDAVLPAVRAVSLIIVFVLILGSVLIVAAVPRAWSELDPSLTVRWAYLTAIALGLALLLVLYAVMEFRDRPRGSVGE